MGIVVWNLDQIQTLNTYYTHYMLCILVAWDLYDMKIVVEY